MCVLLKIKTNSKPQKKYKKPQKLKNFYRMIVTKKSRESLVRMTFAVVYRHTIVEVFTISDNN